MEFLAAIETLAPVAALKRSFIAYPLVNAAHVLAIGAVVTTALLADLRVLGLFARLDAASTLGVLRGVAFAAFALALLTGLALFSIRAVDYAANPAFLLKLAMLALAGVNFAAFGLAMRGRRGPPFPPAARLHAALSLALWPAVLVCGRFIGFVE